jgi:hypothetical protein
MAKKSKRTLEKRIAMLKERGIEFPFGRGVTINDIVDVVGDLTLDEYHDMASLAAAQAYVRVKPSPLAQKASEEQRQQTFQRQAELRARKRQGEHGSQG